MSKGVRMFWARNGSGQRQRAADIVAKGSFFCDSCRVPVDHVDGHTVRGDDWELKREVPPFFRLHPKVVHQQGCSFIPATLIAEVVSRGDDVENTIDPFDGDGRGGFVFRLNIPKSLIRESDGGVDSADPKDSFLERVEKIWSGRELEKYCRSAVGLARLWAVMEGADGRQDLKDQVSIKHFGKEIAWADFFFPFSRYDSLAYRIEGREISHPAAALVIVREINVERSLLVCVPVRAVRGKRDQRVAPKISCAQPLLSNFSIAGRYIVFGDWYPRKPNDWTVPGTSHKIRYRNIGLNIYQRAQFCEVDVPAEDEPDEH